MTIRGSARQRIEGRPRRVAGTTPGPVKPSVQSTPSAPERTQRDYRDVALWATAVAVWR